MPEAYPPHVAPTSPSLSVAGRSGEFDRCLDVPLGHERARDQADLLGLLEQPRRAVTVCASRHLEPRLDDEVREERLAFDAVQRALDLAVEPLPRELGRLGDRAETQQEAIRDRRAQQ